MSETKRKIVRRKKGQVLLIDLKNGSHAYARVLEAPLFAFYDREFDAHADPDITEIILQPVAFKLWVMDWVVTKGIWPVIGSAELEPELELQPAFCKQDKLTGKITIYQELPELAPTFERAATYEECTGLEYAAVWEPIHVEDRLRDHFANKPNKLVESMRLKLT